MKKILFTLSIPLAFLLVSCNSQQDTDWLEGSWKSADWQVTYTFDEEDGNWSIKNGTEVLEKSAKLVEEKSHSLTLKGQDGTSYKIEKKDDNHLVFQQVASQGLMGTTAAVEFEKEGDE